MITLVVDDEHGVPFAVDTFLTVEDARHALTQMEDSLEDCRSSVRAHNLMCAIDQLKEAIAEHEED